MKTVYLYDEKTGEYLGEYMPQESPLEDGIYITPDASTEIKPTLPPSGKYSFFNGTAWTFKDDNRGIWFKPNREIVEIDDIGFTPPPDWSRTKPEKSLSELKIDKNTEINLARLEANQSSFIHSGKAFACDQLSRSDIDGINGYVGTRGSLPSNWIGGWKAVDNTIFPISDVGAWNSFYDSMIAQGQANFMHSQALKSQLAAATTPEQVNSITW